MLEKNTNEPFINIWFGNFYKPAFDDKEFVRDGIKMLKELGFNGIQLDSKAWEDFDQRFKGAEASDYVAQQEYMMRCCRENNIGYNFMALYLCADNLYPNIRFSPPIFGESVTNADGSDGRWYKYWSDKAKDSMITHLRGLFKTYGDGVTRAEINGREVMPTCTMWDPIVAPSFDEEGRERYLNWLEESYGTIDALNAAYKTGFSDFRELRKEDYWYDLKYSSLYTKKELEERSPKAIMWADNMKWRARELVLYFKDMNERIHEINPRIYTMPDMAQWSYFLNIDASELSEVGLSDLWDTSNRGLDIYKLAKYTDCCNFTAVPITPYGDADAYVLSAQHAMMRAMNKGREFLGGVYYGRFLYNDIYEFLTPAEIIGAIVASGAKGYSSYGMCGLDDGGVMHRMDEGFKDSLSKGNEWAKRVIPLIKGERKCPAAILFPSAMSAYEPMGVEGNKERRYDLLGYYKMCADAGFGCDIISIDMIAEGALEDYRALIIPENDCYFLDDNSEAEKYVREWVLSGGIIIHSPDDELVKNCFGIEAVPHDKEPFEYGEKGLPQSDVFRSYEGETVAAYLSNGKNAAAKNNIGMGAVYSMGFAYGYSYSAKIAPHVPLSQKNNELYPVPLMKRNIVADILENEGIERSAVYGKNIETAEFENCVIIVNHTSHPIEIKERGEKIFQYPINDTLLIPRSAAAVIRPVREP